MFTDLVMNWYFSGLHNTHGDSVQLWCLRSTLMSQICRADSDLPC